MAPFAAANGEKLVKLRWLSGKRDAATAYFEPSNANCYTVWLRTSANDRNLHSEREERLMASGGAEKSLRTAPYTSYRTFRTFIEDLREHGVPSRIDRSVLTRFSGVVGGQLMHALRFLGLIDDEGRTTPRLSALVTAHGGAEWAEALTRALQQAYAPIFAIDLETATPSHFSATFRKAFPAADAVVQKCVTFFLYAAADAGLKVSGRILKGRKPRPLAPRGTSRRTAGRAREAEADRSEPLAVAPFVEGKKPSEVLFAQLDPSAMNEEQQAAIWTLLKYFKARGL
jgi:Family of unknown function (DUF5343)